MPPLPSLTRSQNSSAYSAASTISKCLHASIILNRDLSDSTGLCALLGVSCLVSSTFLLAAGSWCLGKVWTPANLALTCCHHTAGNLSHFLLQSHLSTSASAAWDPNRSHRAREHHLASTAQLSSKHLCLLFTYLSLFYLQGREGRERKKEVFHLPLNSPNAS